MGEIVDILGIHVNIDAICSIKHECVPGSCDVDKCCCSRYEVRVTPHEMEKVIDYMPMAAEFVPYLRPDLLTDNLFIHHKDDIFAIGRDERGFCSFSYDSNGEIFCALHSVALKLNRPVNQVKPKSCILWPLSIPTVDPWYLTIDAQAFTFPCNTKRKENNTYPYETIIDIIRELFGDTFLDILETHCLKRS
jgi:hypothetical protein